MLNSTYATCAYIYMYIYRCLPLMQVLFSPTKPNHQMQGKDVIEKLKTDQGKNVLKYIHPNNANSDCHHKSSTTTPIHQINPLRLKKKVMINIRLNMMVKVPWRPLYGCQIAFWPFTQKMAKLACLYQNKEQSGLLLKISSILEKQNYRYFSPQSQLNQ